MLALLIADSAAHWSGAVECWPQACRTCTRWRPPLLECQLQKASQVIGGEFGGDCGDSLAAERARANQSASFLTSLALKTEVSRSFSR